MAGSWGTPVTALNQVALVGAAWTPVQSDIAGSPLENHVITLDYNQECYIELTYTPDTTTPTDHCVVAATGSADGGTTYEDPEMAAHRVTLPFEDSTGDDYVTVTKMLLVTGVHKFILQARIFNPDGTDGTDTGATLDVDYNIVTRS